MKERIYIALAKHDDEIIVLGVGTNGKLVSIQRDSFMMKEEHVDWEAQTQTIDLEFEWKEDKKKDGVSKEKTAPNK